MPQCIRIHPADNVAVALCPIPAGTRLSLEGRAVQMREDIPQGHKLALAQIAAGENIIKYGYPIGHAASDIQVELVHEKTISPTVDILR